MASRQDWLEAGLATLAEDGAQALTIERLSGRLGLTKGSFYHHFRNMGAFRAALLDHFEARYTTSFIDVVERAGGSPRERLDHLLNLALAHGDFSTSLDVAFRAWALQDAEANAAQERVDRRRTEYLRDLCVTAGIDAEEATSVARLMYLVLVGARQVVPPISAEEMRHVYAMAMRLLPDEPRRNA
ncbi:transcriptional regulator, TetR family [Streptoalloteichus tenebrarius]|uniref:Transcriptional regulator, TetR family n=1 Tax=Streptoalloteichus tenebrarius (strain ATCC 17920 / DSM 40477 / JCM 4838 / CBS 697.72 / NBRC 16177 / NCIMB 11028 / NRRL B-12390 / A12253. 1 / ISP 5477) TaxID=1933 RepID=A0ABT1I129_STRSD|nr:TetR/AcrR family transcriptional regulator [Streptoalloteichus tenebrarius]MCP2261487.1 transcriptional regulator, TetR family [Streptoalloteichus tenebrarius]BFE99356.1 TetR/AcrR family transcriptional regulator [Streptoalloteichus tenebrarius]